MNRNWSSLPGFGLWLGLGLILAGGVWGLGELLWDNAPPVALGALFALSLPGLFMLMDSSAYISCTRMSGADRTVWSAFFAFLNSIFALLLVIPFMIYLPGVPAEPSGESMLLLTGPLGLPIAAGFTYRFVGLRLEARRDAVAAD